MDGKCGLERLGLEVFLCLYFQGDDVCALLDDEVQFQLAVVLAEIVQGKSPECLDLRADEVFGEVALARCVVSGKQQQ